MRISLPTFSVSFLEKARFSNLMWVYNVGPQISMGNFQQQVSIADDVTAKVAWHGMA
jgi:hypothetical protein